MENKEYQTRLIGIGCDLFSALTIPVEASIEQRTDIKVAFYAGAVLCFELLNLASTDPSATNALFVVSQINKELDEFGKSLKEYSKKERVN